MQTAYELLESKPATTACTGGLAWECLWVSGLDAAIMMTPCKGWTMTAWGGNVLTCITISDHPTKISN